MDEVDFYLEDLKSKFRKLKNVGGYDKYYLSYSGGKDSHFLYWFIKEYSYPEFKDIKIVGINTYMEHHEIRDRIYKYADIVLLPTLKPFEIKGKYGIPCFSKEQDYYIYYYQNSLRKGKYTSCFTKDKKFTPLWDLTEELEEEIYKKYNIEIPDIYKYIKRTGCMGCPYGSHAGDTEKELELLNDKQHEFVCNYFKESYEVLGVDTSRQMKIGGM